MTGLTVASVLIPEIPRCLHSPPRLNSPCSMRLIKILWLEREMVGDSQINDPYHSTVNSPTSYSSHKQR